MFHGKHAFVLANFASLITPVAFLTLQSGALWNTSSSLLFPCAPIFVCPCQVPKRLLSQDLRFSLQVSEAWHFIHFPPWGPFRPFVLTSQSAAGSLPIVERILESESKDFCALGEDLSDWSFHREFLPGISWDIYVFPNSESEKNCSRNHENREKHNSPASMMVNTDTFLVQQNPPTARVGVLTRSWRLRWPSLEPRGVYVLETQCHLISLPRSQCRVTNVGAPFLLPRASFLQIKYMLVCLCT